jgi:peptidoglycan DL-endopeptidase CwlO
MDENLPATSGTHRDDSFDIAVRGFNRQQVTEYMTRSSQLLATLEQHLAVARADVHRARSEAEQAHAETARLRAEHAETKPVHEEVSGRLSQILRLAAEEADQERATAESQIAKLHAESQAEAERLLTEARLAADGDLAEARETAERELAEARATAEQELGAAREEADRLRGASVQHAEELLDDAQRRAGAVNEVSNQRLETLTATHGEAVLRLGQIRDVLADLLDRDAAAGSLAQVVEAVIAPPGTVPVQIDAADATTVQEPVESTAVQPAVTDEIESGSYPEDGPVVVGEADSSVAADDEASAESEDKIEVLPIEVADTEAEVDSDSDADSLSDAEADSDSLGDDDTEIDLRDPRSRVGSGEASRR